MQIHETAFIVSTYRSHHEDVSKDIYAKMWNNAATDAIIHEIFEKVSIYEAILHSLRNRYFYERMNAFFSNHKGGTFINFGSGFSMYQFSLSNAVATIEIDKKDIIEYKKQKIARWIKDGKLPARQLDYAAINFNKHSFNDIVKTIKSLIKKDPTFILLEGVLFFLDLETTRMLFDVFKKLQKPGDIVGVVTYLPEVEHTAVYKRLLHYFDSNNDTHDSFHHQTLEESYFHAISGYKVIEKIDEFELSKIYLSEYDIQSKSEILNETMFLLKKN
ncbi:class I SAM-dependent methyltransferase [Aquimarina sp. U1-2]|uniref:class I SAM-dependent methyltransferase n=1 Tax=Aquimarina sp. U1-2 TaxID=2823141 RepID=UPI001AEC8BDE|nr:class I SAM-dependent methyltransferase [Aquimarina sp. U1-2]MBP2830793.1 class I SAM-dependent methyltransferase [Aquimarina sp. U1-2]